MVHVTTETNLAIDAPQGRKLFVFDRVFSPETGQDGVWDYVSDCVNAFLQGYNVSLLAYGQSGAGKSYTMGTSGPQEQGDVMAMGKHSHGACWMRWTTLTQRRCYPSRRDGPIRETRHIQAGVDEAVEPELHVPAAIAAVFC